MAESASEVKGMVKHMEIGSIYEIDPDLITHKRAQTVPQLRLGEVEKYHKKHVRYTASGREAIALALKSFEEKRPDASKRCLLPAYMCDTVFFPFERAGWEIHFYHLDRKLTANIDEIKKLTEEVNPELIFIHTYYGVETWGTARSIFQEWRAQGICIMEDVTQSYYLESAGREADYCVGSLRKWYAVPDGGFVASDEELSVDNLSPNREFTEARLGFLTEKWEYLHGQRSLEESRALKRDYLDKNREAERWLDAYEGIGAISEEASYLLSLTDEEECKEKRRENCRYLNEHLRGSAWFTPVFDETYESGQTEAAPLYYPVYAAHRDELQRFLSSRGVYAPTLWPVGKENADALSEEEIYIFEHILALPIDQRYGPEEMQYIVQMVNRYGELKEANEVQTIGIRVDANDTVATGHVMRCITIAKQLISAGSKVLFFTADEYAAELLEQAGMQYVCLHTRWDRMEDETAILRRELVKANCRKLLVDSYQVTEKYFEHLSDLCKLIYIDDCFEKIYPVDMLINYNAYHVRFPYEEAYAGRAKLLLGTAYVPLREEFGSMGTAADDLTRHDGSSAKDVENTHVLLSSGGGDRCNALSGILAEAVQDEILRHVIFDVVVGGFNRNAEELERLAKEHPNIRLHYRVEHMAKLMGQCTAAVSAAGTMLFELSAMQTPTVFFVSADNQQYDHEFFAAEERMLYAGDIREDRNKCLQEICSQLKLILEDEPMRDRMKKKLHEVTDGNGTQRIAEEIIRLEYNMFVM